MERDFAAAVTDLDSRVGAVLSAVREAGIDEGTVVFFSSVCAD